MNTEINKEGVLFMAIRGDAQIEAGSIFKGQINAAAGIELTQLAKGLALILRDGSVAMTENLDIGGKALINLGAVTDATGDGYAATVKYVKDKFATIVSPIQYKGTDDAAVGLPADVKKGFLYLVSGAGTIGGKILANGDMIVANKDVVGATAISDFDEIDNQQYVTAVAGKTGDITLELADITGLVDALAGKADKVHTHAIADTTGLQTALDNKAETGHKHAVADVTGLQGALDALQAAIKFADNEIPVGVKDGVNKAFTVAHAIVGGLQVFRNGVFQSQGVEITAGGTGFPFTGSQVAPAPTESIVVFYRY